VRSREDGYGILGSEGKDPLPGCQIGSCSFGRDKIVSPNYFASSVFSFLTFSLFNWLIIGVTHTYGPDICVGNNLLSREFLKRNTDSLEGYGNKGSCETVSRKKEEKARVTHERVFQPQGMGKGKRGWHRGNYAAPACWTWNCNLAFGARHLALARAPT